MSSNKPIGGYFGLELGVGGFMHSDATLLNSGRNCLEYILKSNKAKKVYLSRYTCDVVLQPLKKLNIPYSFYSINEKLEIDTNLEVRENEFVVYIDYFGVKDKYCEHLSQKYGKRLILDCSQAYYFEPSKISHTFYSSRKFFGVPDGGLLYTDKILDEEFEVDISYQRCSHLLKRIDIGAEQGYEDFKNNDKSLNNQPIKTMSHLTERLLRSVDYSKARETRINNFNHLDKHLRESNSLNIDSNSISGPLHYPLLTEDSGLRKKLIKNKVYVATYWPNVFEWCGEEEVEHKLAKNIIPLPIDQRYDIKDMERIVKIINEN
ncbi:MAG TPA: hypothetical protein VFC41_04585 [Anaerovoracaceae bacterium]|nr:hypothetical protein [Anaerovoracaceae bacterium]